jgi:hypothetical protein
MTEDDRDTNQDPVPGDPLGNGDIHAAPDATLGGYIREHSRSPAFEGADGEPYTVSIEIEKTGRLPTPFEGYLVFPRWASTGIGVVGHVETHTLIAGQNREQIAAQLSALPLVHVKMLLDGAITAREGETAAGDESPEPRSDDLPDAPR